MRRRDRRKEAGAGLVEEVKFFAGLEANRLAGSDADLGAGPGIAADAGLAGLDGEDAESPKFNAFAGDKGLLHALEDGIDGRLCLGPRESGTFNDSLNEILLDQGGSAFPVGLKGEDAVSGNYTDGRNRGDDCQWDKAAVSLEFPVVDCFRQGKPR